MKISRKNILSDNISFERSFRCWMYNDTDLIDAIYERGWEHIPQHYVAELYIRLCFNPNNEKIKNCLTQILPHSLLTLLLEECKKFPYGDTRLATDLDNGNIRKVKEAIEKRWREYANADGSFPVCNETSAYLIPFILIKKNSLTSEVLDYQNKQIPEWSQAIEELKLDYSVKLLIEWDEDCHLTGHSLQLPMFLAALTKSEQLLPFDPYRFIATGAIVADKLKAVVFYNKYRELYVKFPQACFVCPKPAEDQEGAIANNIGIMPEGLNLTDIRNFCLEFIVQNKLFKHAAVNREFVGRQRQLCKIHSLLNPSFQRNKKTPLLLGASGIGKTALAKHYAQMCSPYEYREYVLLDGEKKSLPDIFEMLYVNKFYREKCGFNIPDTMKSEEKFKLLIHQLEQCGKRILFILDNLSPDLQLDADIKTFFPTYSDSCIDFIATSTVHSFNVNENDVVEFIQIDGLSKSEGLELLRSKRNTDSHDEKEAAEKIVRFVGGNAWALDVIGETLKQSPEKFDDDYREKLKELKSLPLETLTPNSGMVRISHEKEIDPVKLLQPVLARLDQEILEIAQAAACCASEYIYPKWLQKFYELKHNVKLKNERQWRKEKIIAKLIQSNILSADEMGSEYYRMHRLTHLIIRKIYKEKNLQTENNLLRAVAADKPMCCPAEIIAAGHLLANISAAYSQAFELLSAGKDHLLSLLLRSSQYGLARTLISRFLPLSENTEIVASEEHQREYTINLLYCLVETKLLDNELDQALEIMNKVCDIQKSASHVDYCSSLCETARIYIWLKKYEKAAEFLDEVRRIIEKHNLCNTYIHYVYLRRSAILDNWLAWQKGNPEFYKYAESKLKEALLIREKLSEPLYETIRLRHLLGDCLRFQGKIKECLKIYTVCEEYYIKELGENNITTAQLFINKADALTSIRDFQGAINYLSKAQRVHEDLLGSNHKFTQKDYRKLQELYNILQNQKKELFYRQKCITN